MPANNRTRFLILFSVRPETMEPAGDFIARRLTRRFGGATLFYSPGTHACTGYWADDGQEFKTEYEGEIHSEPVMTLMLSVLQEDESDAYQRIQQVLSDAARQFQLDTRHVHVESQTVVARHFTVTPEK